MTQGAAQAIMATKYQPQEPLYLSFSGFRLFAVEGGRARVVTPQGAFWANDGDAFLLQPGTAYEVSAEDEAWLADIAFTREAFMQACLPTLAGCSLLTSFFVHSSEHSDMTFLHFAKTDAVIRETVRRMIDEYGTREVYYQQVLLCSLTSLLLYLNRNCWVDCAVTEAPGSQLVQRLMSYMIAHYEDVSLETMAEAFHYHPNTVAAVLKKGTGKTFSQLLLQTRMGHAAQLLTHSRLSADEVAARCGYSNVSYFYARFHRFFGMTPGEYALRATRQAGAQGGEGVAVN